MKTLAKDWYVYELFLFGICLSAGFVLCPFILYGLTVFLGKTYSLLDIINMLVFDREQFSPKEIKLIAGIILIPYLLYLLTKINYLARFKALKKTALGNKKVVVALLFLVPAITALLLVKVLYLLNSFFSLPYLYVYHLNLIGNNFPIFLYGCGLFISAYIFSGILLKLNPTVAGYLTATLIGIAIYYFAVVNMILFYDIYRAFLLGLPSELISKLLMIPFQALFAFSGFCFQDCLYGYAWPSIPIGAILAVLILRFKTKLYS